MAKTTPEKTHALLEKLAEYVINEVSTKKEVDDKIGKVDEKIERLRKYIENEVPTKIEFYEELNKKADKKDIQKILDGQDAMVNQLDIIRTEQYAFNAAFNRREKRVETLET